MDEHSSTKNPKRRRRALTWGIFGLAGVIMSTAWATGFDSSVSETSGAAAANAFGQGAAIADTPSKYLTWVNESEKLDITFDGDWGEIRNQAAVFEVILGTEEEGIYYTDIYVDNPSFVLDWSAAQFKWQRFDGLCADAVFTDSVDPASALAADPSDPIAPKVMNVTTTDSHVSFKGLAGGSTYCFGIAPTNIVDEESAGKLGHFHADDQMGTQLIRPDSTVPPTPPIFTAIVNRSGD